MLFLYVKLKDYRCYDYFICNKLCYFFEWYFCYDKFFLEWLVNLYVMGI